MYSRFSRGIALLALVTFAPVAVSADAMSDQKKALQAMGYKIPHPPAMCNLVKQSEAAHYLGKPVKAGESAGIDSGCAYRAADGSNDGLLVVRHERGDWYPSKKNPQYRSVSGVGEQAYTSLEPSLGCEAGVLNARGTTIVQMSGKASADTALALARIAMNR